MNFNSVSLKKYCDAIQMVEVLVRNGYECHVTPGNYNEELDEYESFYVDYIVYDDCLDECDGDCENCPYNEELVETKKDEELFKKGSYVKLEKDGKYLYGLISTIYPKSLNKSGLNEYDVMIPLSEDYFIEHATQKELELIK